MCTVYCTSDTCHKKGMNGYKHMVVVLREKLYLSKSEYIVLK